MIVQLTDLHQVIQLFYHIRLMNAGGRDHKLFRKAKEEGWTSPYK